MLLTQRKLQRHNMNQALFSKTKLLAEAFFKLTSTNNQIYCDYCNPSVDLRFESDGFPGEVSVMPTRNSVCRGEIMTFIEIGFRLFIIINTVRNCVTCNIGSALIQKSTLFIK